MIDIEKDHVITIILVLVVPPIEGIITLYNPLKTRSHRERYSNSNHRHSHSRHHKSHHRHHNKSPSKSKSSQKTPPVKFQIQTGFSDAPSNPALLNPPPPQVLFPETLPTPFTPAPSNQKATTPLFPQPPNPNLVQSLALLPTASKTDRKLYIGNLPAGLTQQTLVQLLNNTILSVKPEGFAPGEPIISAWISADGHYAFVEFRSPEEANLGFVLNGVNVM